MNVGMDDLPRTLRTVLRPAPQIGPEDSLENFVQTIRYQPLTELPVIEDGRLCGIVSQEDALPILALPESQREYALRRPVAEVMHPPLVVARPEMSPDEIGRLCARHQLRMLPVVDEEGYCLGIVLASDLLTPELPPVYPHPVGGMATPFGVYLTNGTLRAGVGDFALATSGFMIGAFSLLSAFLVDRTIWVAHRYAHLPNWPVFDLDAEPTTKQPLLGLVSIGWSMVILVVFLLLIRLSRIAGYHAAEHQTVHAMERRETLVPEIVARMPRAHPRCGTNLMAAGIVFFTVLQTCAYIPGLSMFAPVVALLTAFLFWRRIGTVLQDRFTTKPASEKQLVSGIAAANALLEKYLNTPPSRPKPLQRLWCMGLLQTAAGMGVAYGIYQLITLAWTTWKH